MLTAYFKNPRILARYEQGPAGPELEAFAAWLAQRGFQRSSVCRCIRVAHKFTLWGIDAGLILPRLDRDALAAFAEPLRLKHSHGGFQRALAGAGHFVDFLAATHRLLELAPDALTPQ